MFRKNKNSEKNRCPRKEHPVWSLARSANMFMYRKNKNSEGLSKQGNRLSNEGDYYQQRKTEAGN
uniref:Uncharacterized protein n=1 Tax=Candidatus Kentrum sp. SD TaxID=2126332 RepID=A0A450Z7Y8_9GAMM|nr:MAG: hypothetical protein BECKSD772F_GA0070984_12743 [Candidatus Kentron sp. SD]VFK49895.1 MAG: hypothetical protein BECKSD772E_GA0070983_12711 [Candidatus Kentron sp. SD]